eukprot:GFUD01036808.1.p1 GENE.GFUD01036808.1~~GFUD01036808.1.p1  ORF type:complete len:145 (-),score=32.81 GFUD01036808.1:41-475(-)
MAGGTPHPLQHPQENEEKIFDLDFPFPRPREQTSQDLLGSNHQVSSARDYMRLRNSVRRRNDSTTGCVRLVQAILRGESGNSLVKKIEDAKGLQTLLHLKLRIKDTASKESTETDSDVLIEILLSLFHLAVVENKHRTFITMLN